MTAQNRTTLKAYFETGDRPSHGQFSDTIDSFLNLVDAGGQSIISDVSALGSLNVAGNLTGGTAQFSSDISVSGTATVGSLTIVNSQSLTLNALTVTGAATISSLSSAGVITNNSSGVLTTNTRLPATQFPALTGDVTNSAGALATTLGKIGGIAIARTSWTPVLNFGGATTGITYSQQVGSYMRIGQFVVAEFQITLSSKGSAVGGATITGLPIAANASGVIIFGQRTNTATNFANNPGGIITASTISLQFASVSGSGSLVDTDFNNNTLIYGTAIYLAA